MSKANQAQNASMDEILSSIRSIVKEEQQRPGSTPDAEDDVLELTEALEEEAPVAEAEAAPAEEFVDINAFAKTGESVPADATAVKAARQKYESETAPVTEEQKQAATEAAELPSTDELVAEMANEALVDKAVAETNAAEAAAQETAPAEETAAVAEAETPVPAAEEAPVAQPATAPAQPAAPSFAAGKPVSLKAVPGAQGLQVAFPVEVLAEALRPMIKDWVEANLPTIVEKLVRDELSRLVDKS